MSGTAGSVTRTFNVGGGEILVGPMAAFTLPGDHRAVDGAVGARLMAALRERLEDPLGMML